MNFQSKRSGFLRQNLSGEKAYFSFVPSPLPPNPIVELDEDMRASLKRIYIGIGRLQTISEAIPDVNMFLAMYVRKEALFSSQIEGTQATLDDILDPMIEENANRDVTDVIDNVKAVTFAVSQILDPNGLPLSLRLLRETHNVLLNHSRGHDKNPGTFRNSQNWIGPTGCTLLSAAYVPPNVEDMNKALCDLEMFIHDESSGIDPIVKAALIHYQFETIHPFLDGNGRIGRLLILLYLLHADLLKTPMLYISYFLKLNRSEYYDRMMSVRRVGSYEEWVRFFLIATEAAISDTLESVNKLCELHGNDSTKIKELKARSTVVQRRLDFLGYLEHTPIIEIKRTAVQLGLSFPTVSKMVKIFVDLGILKEMTGKNRSRIFVYEAYLAVLRKDSTPI